jgi:hypothetical protein
MDEKFDEFDKVLDKFLKNETPDFSKFTSQDVDVFEVAMLLKEKKHNPQESKEKVFLKVLSSFREEKGKENSYILSVLLKIFEVLFDVSPLNNFEHLTFNQVYKSNEKTLYQVKFSLYLQSRQFLYNSIWSLQLPLGFETLR